MPRNWSRMSPGWPSPWRGRRTWTRCWSGSATRLRPAGRGLARHVRVLPVAPRISRQLIREKGFSFIGVEGDWPDCHRVNRYVKALPDSGADAREVLDGFAMADLGVGQRGRRRAGRVAPAASTPGGGPEGRLLSDHLHPALEKHRPGHLAASRDAPAVGGGFRQTAQAAPLRTRQRLATPASGPCRGSLESSSGRQAKSSSSAPGIVAGPVGVRDVRDEA